MSAGVYKCNVLPLRVSGCKGSFDDDGDEEDDDGRLIFVSAAGENGMAL